MSTQVRSKLESVKKWQSSVNIDYLSLYIKTWFAFLATVQDLHPSHISHSGDKAVINEYIEKITIPRSMNDLTIQFHKVYKNGYDLFKIKKPDSFFGQFYSINKNFSMVSSYGDKHSIKIEYRDKIQSSSGNNPNLLVTLNSNIKKFKDNINDHYVSINIPLTNLINNKSSNTSEFIFLHNDECIKVLQDDLANEIRSKVRSSGKRKVQEKEGYCLGELALIIQALRVSNNNVFSDLFHTQIHKNYYGSGNQTNNEIKILKWFLMFNYHVRNLLFHSVIDPFDEQWLKLFKHAYLVLKEIVEHNIEEIERKALEVNNNMQV